jgi:hypothetical protein
VAISLGLTAVPVVGLATTRAYSEAERLGPGFGFMLIGLVLGLIGMLLDGDPW